MLGIIRKVTVFTIITSVCRLQIWCSHLKNAIVDSKKKALRMARTMIMGVSCLQCKKSLSRIGLFTFKTIQLKDVIIEVY